MIRPPEEHEDAAVAFLVAKYEWGPVKMASLWSSLAVLAFPVLVVPWVDPIGGLWVPWALAAGTCGTLLPSFLGDLERLRSCQREEGRYAASRDALLAVLEADPLLVPHHAEYPYSHLLAAYGFDGRHEHPKGAGHRLVEVGDGGRRVAAVLLARQAERARRKGVRT